MEAGAGKHFVSAFPGKCVCGVDRCPTSESNLDNRVLVALDIKACTKGKRLWDQSFSPLQVGKAWFYGELGKLAPVQIVPGWETKVLREQKGLKKTGRKTAELMWVAQWVGNWACTIWTRAGDSHKEQSFLNAAW